MKIEIDTKFSIGDIVYAVYYNVYEKFVIKEIHSTVIKTNNSTRTINTYVCQSVEPDDYTQVHKVIEMEYEEYQLKTKENLKQYLETLLNE